MLIFVKKIIIFSLFYSFTIVGPKWENEKNKNIRLYYFEMVKVWL
jgi:hypothetical protein